MESFLIQSNLAAAQSAGNLLTSKNGSKTFKVILMTFHNNPTRPSLYTGLTPVYIASHRERDDSYSNVILQLAPRWRIIECRNAEQWIIQKRTAEPLDRGKWTGVSYVVSRDKLIDLSTSLGLLSEPSRRAVLEALPSTIREYALKQVRP